MDSYKGITRLGGMAYDTETTSATAALARTGIEVVLDRLPDIDLAVPAESLTRRPSPWLRGLTALPVRFAPVPAL